MKKEKWTKKGNCHILFATCENCYRKQYCQFTLEDNNCILFKPSNAKRLEDYHNEYILANK